VLEAVPNVSEGRDLRSIEAIGAAFAAPGVAVLDVHSDADHHRSVFTLAGEDAALLDGLVAGVGAAVDLVDLRTHAGVHPRVGAADVVPLVPLHPSELDRAKAAAIVLAGRIGDELGLAVFLYGEVGGGRRPVFFRRGGLAELTRRVEAGELVPDAGPRRVDQRSGVVLVGARRPLVAYNVVLDTDDVTVAAEIAAAVRESGGGIAGLQAIGLVLPSTGAVQVSMNVLDLERAALHEVVPRVQREAELRGLRVLGGELVGLVPERVVREAYEAGVELPGVDQSRTLERALASRLGAWPAPSS